MVLKAFTIAYDTLPSAAHGPVWQTSAACVRFLLIYCMKGDGNVECAASREQERTQGRLRNRLRVSQEEKGDLHGSGLQLQVCLSEQMTHKHMHKKNAVSPPQEGSLM